MAHESFTISDHDTTARHPKTVIKTATGSSSGSVPAEGDVIITMHDYAFFPNIYSATATFVGNCTSNIDDTIGRFGVANLGSSSCSYVVRWRYITASNNPQIWVVRDATSEIIGIWQADDPPHADDPFKEVPIRCFDKDRNPIGIPHYIEVPSFYDEFLATLKEGLPEIKKRYSIREHNVRPKRLPQNVIFGKLIKK